MTHGVLPVLNSLWFKGFSTYLEDILAYVDAPLRQYMVLQSAHL